MPWLIINGRRFPSLGQAFCYAMDLNTTQPIEVRDEQGEIVHVWCPLQDRQPDHVLRVPVGPVFDGPAQLALKGIA